MELSDALRRLAETQLGVVTRRQLRDGGMTAGEIRWAIGRQCRVLLPGVLLLQPELPTTEQRRVAALLLAGPGSWLAGPAALDAHRLRQERESALVHVYVPPTRTPRQILWVSIRRTYLLDERVVERGALRYSCRARAVVDTAATLPIEEARALVIEMVQRRVVRLDDVVHWVEAREPAGRPALRRAVTEAAAGAWSRPEADLAALLRRSRVLPEAWANPELRDMNGTRLTTPDLWIDDVGMAVMVHRRVFHAGTLDWDATVESDGDLSAARVVVVGVTPTALARDPHTVLRRVEHAYETARRSGLRAPVVAERRHTAVARPIVM